MTPNGEVQLPPEVIEALELEPGNAVAFERGPAGEVILVKGRDEPQFDAEAYRQRLERLVGSAGPGLTTDEIMEMTRGRE